MKKTLQVYLRSLLLSGMFLFIGYGAYANHISAMDLSYTFVSSTGSGATLSSTYQVTIVIYGNCSDNTGSFATLPTSSPQVCVYNGSTLVSTLNLAIVAAESGINVTNVCPADTGLTTCTSTTSTIDGVKKYVYTANVVLTGTSAVWRFIYNGNNGTGAAAGRSSQATSINPPGSTVVQLIDTLNNTNGPNTSTSLPIIPTPYYCLGDPDNYNPGATNVDGDSLVFQLVTARDQTSTGCSPALGGAATYFTGYSPTAPINSASAFSFSSVNGQISFTTSLAQVAVVDYNIREFRSGVLVGTCMREMNVAVKTCTTGAPTGTIRTPTNGAVTSDSTTFEACLNSGVFSFTVAGQEPDTSYQITMTASNIPAGATYTIANNNTNHPVATFTWTATGNPSGTYPFDILYSSNSCPVPSSGSVAYNVIIEPNPAAIAGTKTVCTGFTTTLTDSLTGGTWISSNTALATAGSSTGVISGAAAGLDTITYSYSAAGCKATTPVTVTGPAAITGTKTVCQALTTALTDATTGGVWTTSNTATATVGSTGIVTGVAGGTANITYTLSSTGCFVIAQVTVTALAAITPANPVVCIGNTVTLHDATSGGAWSSSATGIATVTSAGIVGGVASGNVDIFYTVGTCYATALVSVSATGPGPITPSTAVSVCIGGTATLADASTGGTWSSSSTNATVNSTTGVVTGVAAGAATISYFLGGCYVTKPVTVISGIAAITPATSTICIANSETLTETTTGGVWSSNAAGVATVAAATATTGTVGGVASGTAIISYSIGTCSVSATVTVSPGPQPISPTGPVSICQGTTTTLTDVTSGGTWASNASTIASVTSPGGVVTGSTLGSATISYTQGGCAATVVVTVVPTPAALLPATAVICTGNTQTLTETVAGGTWSSSASTIASVTSGVVTGVSVGTAIITYASGTCRVTASVTVNLAPDPGLISGPSLVCVGGTATLTESATGGTWSSNTTGVATVTAGGVVTGVSTGTALISYSKTSSCGTVSTTHLVTVNLSPSAGTLSGATNVCSGTTSSYSSTVTGGTWMASNTHANINSTSGLLTGVSPGNDTLTYTVTSSCGTVAATQVVVIGAFLSAGTITGTASSLCAGASITLSDATTGGTWSSSNTSATVTNTGLVTGAAGGGPDTINYTITSACGSAVATYPITVNATAAAGSIVGSPVLCVGTSALFTDSPAGGIWSSSNTNASVNSTSGLVTGLALGTSVISYTVSNSCGTSTATEGITMSATVTAGTITASSTSLCIGSSATFIDGAAGGVWSSSNTAVAVVTGGVVTGVGTGTAIISYTVTTGCGTAAATQAISVNSTVITAGTITGPSSVCVSSLITLSDATGGGAWSASNGNSPVTTAGIVTGVHPGLDTISYTITSSCGIAQTTKVITITALSSTASISGPSTVCVGTSVPFTDATGGGVWSSLNTNASVNPTSGLVTGLSAGADVITYSVTTACGTVGTTMAITITPSASAGSITGSDTVCLGSTTTLFDGTGGGVWSSGNANAGVSGGVVTGLAVGTAPISYTVTNSCGVASAVSIVTIVPSASAGTISGLSAVCAGSGITLTDPAPGGTWIASNGNAFVAGAGIIDGVTVGIDTIFYVVTNSCGTSTTSRILAVNPTPIVDPVNGPTHQCTGTLILLLDGVGGGIWTSNDTSIAHIDPTTGVITGMGVGIATLSYTVTNGFGCPATMTSIDTVTASPGLTAITGSPTACIGSTTTLSNTTAGGVWSSADASVATIDPATGVLTGVSTGTVIISYTVVNSCGTSFVVAGETINPAPIVDPVTGPTTVCIGSVVTLSDGTAGGTWSSSDGTIATVDASGNVTGVAGGFATINYNYTGSCPITVTSPMTVIAGPAVAAITGTNSECVGTTTNLFDGTGGGVWSSSNTALATVTPDGVVSGIVAGTVTISYTVTAGCASSATIVNTVLGIPGEAPITGIPASVCAGVSIPLANAFPDGIWSSANTSIATIDPVTGVAIGGTGGTVRIYYTISDICGSALDSANITISPSPSVSAIIAAYTSLCAGTTVHLSDGVAGGIWSSSNTAIAVVNSTTGLVTGVSGGTDTVRYTITNAGGCTNSAMIGITIGGSISSGAISPAGSVTICHGHTVLLHVVSASGAGTTYQWLLNGGAITGATNVSYTATSIGLYTVVIDNGICSETITGTTVVSPPNPVITLTPPNILSTSSFPAYQWYLNGNPIPGANGSAVSETGAGTYKVVVTDYNGCSDTSGGYIVTGQGVNNVNNITSSQDIKVYPNPASTTLNIDAPVNVNVSIISIDGKVLVNKKEATSIDVSQLADGMYMIMIYDENDLLLKATKFAKAR